jgi:DNA-directed RNA polymerase specialized sigma24 family protein
MNPLKDQMNMLVTAIQQCIYECRKDGLSNDIHHEVCVRLATSWGLWERDMFPIWLSRIVAGEMQDMGIVDHTDE